MATGAHPRDKFITLFGRKPVIEVLGDPSVAVRRVVLAEGSQGPEVKEIRRLAHERKLTVEMASRDEVARLSRHKTQDQGVAADVEAARMETVESFLSSFKGQGRERRRDALVLALDHVTTPANVGLVLRSAVAFGLDGVVLAREGSPEVGPLVVKASAGYAYRAPILRCARLPEALDLFRRAGFQVVGLRADAPRLGAEPLSNRAVLVLGNESVGIGPETAERVTHWAGLPLASSVDSLNVACAAAVVCWELRGRPSGGP